MQKTLWLNFAFLWLEENCRFVCPTDNFVIHIITFVQTFVCPSKIIWLGRQLYGRASSFCGRRHRCSSWAENWLLIIQKTFLLVSDNLELLFTCLGLWKSFVVDLINIEVGQKTVWCSRKLLLARQKTWWFVDLQSGSLKSFVVDR